MLTRNSEQIYRRCQSLRKPQSNIRLLLIWSFVPHSQTLEVLRHWIESEESLHLYQQLIDDLRSQQTPEEFVLTLAALLSRERLLLHAEDDTDQPMEDEYLIRFDAIVNGEDVSNKWMIFERIILSLLRVLHALRDEKYDLIELLANVLGKRATLLKPLDDVDDRYCENKIDELDHSKAFQEVRR